MKYDWEMVPLGNFLQRIKDEVEIDDFETYQRLTIHLNNKGIDIRDEVEGSFIGTKRQFVVTAGQFLLSKIDARNGAFGIVPQTVKRGIITGNFWAYDVDETKLSLPYFNYLTHTSLFQDFCVRSSSGTTNRRYLREDLFLAREIPLPPLPEQQRIVARIEALARRVQEARGLRKQAVEEAEVLLDRVVGEVFDTVKSEYIDLLGKLATKIGSGSTPSGGRASYPANGIPFIRSQNVRMREFQMEGIAFIDVKTHENMKGTKVRPNDVLLNITGASIGRVACVPSNVTEANVNQHVAIIRPTEKITPRYLMYWLSQPAVQEFINSEQKGATRQGFTKQQIEKFELPVLPLSEQHRIIAYLDGLQAKVDELRRLQDETQQELDALMPSILAKAFGGEL